MDMKPEQQSETGKVGGSHLRVSHHIPAASLVTSLHNIQEPNDLEHLENE